MFIRNESQIPSRSDQTLFTWMAFADILVAIAYFLIPMQIVYFYRRVKHVNIPFILPVIVLFAGFITSCASVHTIQSFHPWYPMPRFMLAVKWVTALVSLLTSAVLFLIIPRVLTVPQQMESLASEAEEHLLTEESLKTDVTNLRTLRDINHLIRSELATDAIMENVLVGISDYLGARSVAFYKANNLQKKRGDHAWNKSLTLPAAVVEDFRERPVVLFLQDGRGLLAAQFQCEEAQCHLLILFNELPTPPDELIALLGDTTEQLSIALSQARAMELERKQVDELRQRNDALLSARREAKVMAQESREWVSVMSHEMRTPLFGVIALTQMVLDRTDLSDETQDLVETIKRSGDLLLEIVNNILDFSKYEDDSFRLSHEPFWITDSIESALEVVVHQDDKRWGPSMNIDYCCRPFVVVGDSTRFRQVVLNLVSNAVKFTPDEGSVIVHVYEPDVKNGKVYLTCVVEDTGIGISEANQQKLFQKFSQGDGSMTRKYGGTGLGLVICKQLCQHMHGDVTVTSNCEGRDKGSKFTFTVALDEFSKADWPTFDVTGGPASKVHNPQSKRIAYVGDNRQDVFYFKKMMSSIDIENIIILPTLGAYVTELVVDVIFVEMRSVIKQGSLEDFHSFVSGVSTKLWIVGLTNPMIRKKQTPATFENLRQMYRPIKRTILIRTLNEFFPEAPESFSHVPEAPSNQAWQKSVKVLVAEDNAINQMVLQKMLDGLGVESTIVGNGRLALEKVKEPIEYDVILMDIMMPEMDGYESTRKIRMHTGKANRPYIIGLSANAFWDDKLKAFEAGMNDFVTKPVTSKALKAALHKSMG